MSVTVIILGILLVVLIYILYLYLSPTAASLKQSASLMTNTPAITNLTSPTSPRYAYGLWIYVNSWSASPNQGTTAAKVIFSRFQNIQLYLDSTKLNLYADIFMNNQKYLSDATNAGAPVLITDNFPLQKWCCVVLSVDNNFLDCYLDGKLVLSQKLSFMSKGVPSVNVNPAPPPDVPPANGGAAVILGGSDGGNGTVPSYSSFDAVVNNFQQWPNPLNPQMAYDNYMAGNGSVFSKMSSFNAKVNILKNNASYTSFSLF